MGGFWGNAFAYVALVCSSWRESWGSRRKVSVGVPLGISPPLLTSFLEFDKNTTSDPPHQHQTR